MRKVNICIWWLRYVAVVVVSAVGFLLAGCSGFSAVNVPGLGYFNFDPPPVDAVDKAMMYDAMASAAEQGRVGATTTWHNPQTGNRGQYVVTRLMTRRFSVSRENPLYSIYLPAVEIDEYIDANNGREYKTLEMNFYHERNGVWYRYR